MIVNSLSRTMQVGVVCGCFMLAMTAVADKKTYRYFTNAEIRPSTQALGKQGRGTTVAVFESGGWAEPNHSVFGNRLTRVCLEGLQTCSFNAREHSTAVSSVVAAKHSSINMGVAPGAKLLSYNVNPSGYVPGHDRLLQAAIGNARSRGASIVNMSYGPKNKPIPFYSSTSNVIIKTRGEKVLVVVAAGNDGRKYQNLKVGTAGPQIGLGHVMLVGSVHGGTRQISPFSSRPGEACFVGKRNRCGSNDKYKNYFIVAPGDNSWTDGERGLYVATGLGSTTTRSWVPAYWVPGYWVPGYYGYYLTIPGYWVSGYMIGGYYTYSTSTYSKYSREKGTSVAAPMVAGAAALLHSRWPVLKRRPVATANILFTTATDLGTKGVDGTYGWGLLNVKRAMGPLGAIRLQSNKKILGKVGSAPRPGSSSGGGGSSGGDDKWNTRSVPGSIDSRLRVSTPLGVLAKHTISVFDDYDRDFQIPLATVVDSNKDMSVAEWIKPGSEIRQYHEISGQSGGMRWSVLPNQYNSRDPDLMDIGWQGSFHTEFGGHFRFGHGNGSKMFVSASNTLHNSGEQLFLDGVKHSLLSYAGGGPYTIIGQQFGSGWDMQVGGLSNAGFGADEEDRNFAPRTDALVLSIGKRSWREGTVGSLMLAYLTEERGLLGTMGSGGLKFTDGFDSLAATLTGGYDLGRGYRVSGWYTHAKSTGNLFSSGVLTLRNNTFVSDSISFGLEKTDIFSQDDRLKISLSQPLLISSGKMLLTYDDHYDEDGHVHSKSVEIDLASGRREIDYQLEYQMSVKRNLKLGLMMKYKNHALYGADIGSYSVGVKLNGYF